MTARRVYNCTTTIKTASGNAWWLFEVEGDPSIAVLWRKIVADGGIVVTKLTVERGAHPGQRIVVARGEAVLARDGIATITASPFELIEAPK